MLDIVLDAFISSLYAGMMTLTCSGAPTELFVSYFSFFLCIPASAAIKTIRPTDRKIPTINKEKMMLLNQFVKLAKNELIFIFQSRFTIGITSSLFLPMRSATVVKTHPRLLKK